MPHERGEAPKDAPMPRFKFFVVLTNDDDGDGSVGFTPLGVAGYRLYGIQAHSNSTYGTSISKTWVTLIYELDRPESGPEDRQ